MRTNVNKMMTTMTPLTFFPRIKLFNRNNHPIVLTPKLFCTYEIFQTTILISDPNLTYLPYFTIISFFHRNKLSLTHRTYSSLIFLTSSKCISLKDFVYYIGNQHMKLTYAGNASCTSIHTLNECFLRC